MLTRLLCVAWCFAAVWMIIALFRACPNSVVDRLTMPIQCCIQFSMTMLIISVALAFGFVIAYG